MKDECLEIKKALGNLSENISIKETNKGYLLESKINKMNFF